MSCIESKLKDLGEIAEVQLLKFTALTECSWIYPEDKSAARTRILDLWDNEDSWWMKTKDWSLKNWREFVMTGRSGKVEIIEEVGEEE